LVRLDQPRAAQHLEMGRGVGQAEGGFAGELLDAALALGEQVEQLEPMRAGERLADDGEFAEEPILERAIAHLPPLFKESIEYSTSIRNAVAPSRRKQARARRRPMAARAAGAATGPFNCPWGCRAGRGRRRAGRPVGGRRRRCWWHPVPAAARWRCCGPPPSP